MQLATQLSQPNPAQVAASRQAPRPATGSVASPPQDAIQSVAVSPTPSSHFPSLVQPVLAAGSTKVSSETALVFHSPLRSYWISQYFSRSHLAIDMAAPMGTPIYASTVGTVAGTGYLLQGGGLMVRVDHPSGYTTYYAHMSVITSHTGEQVDNSVQIGRVGATGWATGPHLHFMLLHNGVAVNPLSLLQK